MNSRCQHPFASWKNSLVQLSFILEMRYIAKFPLFSHAATLLLVKLSSIKTRIQLKKSQRVKCPICCLIMNSSNYVLCNCSIGYRGEVQ